MRALQCQPWYDTTGENEFGGIKMPLTLISELKMNQIMPKKVLRHCSKLLPSFLFSMVQCFVAAFKC
jgi:hypothetical protein